MEPEFDSAADGDEDANIRAAQAILFRSRTKAAPSKEDQQGRMELKVTPRRPGPLTPSRREVASPAKGNPEEKIDARFGTTPVKAAMMNGLTGTPRGALSLSGSKQRCEDLHHKIDENLNTMPYTNAYFLLQVKEKMVGTRIQYY